MSLTSCSKYDGTIASEVRLKNFLSQLMLIKFMTEVSHWNLYFSISFVEARQIKKKYCLITKYSAFNVFRFANSICDRNPQIFFDISRNFTQFHSK